MKTLAFDRAAKHVQALPLERRYGCFGNSSTSNVLLFPKQPLSLN